MIFHFLIFAAGLASGSFYACGIARFCAKSPIFTKRSKCPNCCGTLKWYQLVPIISFLMQKGHCSFCRGKISFFYPLTEFLFGAASLLTYLKFGLTPEFAFYCFAVHIILIAGIIDCRLLIIPDLFTVYSFLLFLPLGYWLTIVSPENILSSFICFAVLYLCHAYFLHIRKLEALGLGDVKFVLFLGLFLLPREIPLFFMIASGSALCYSIFFHFKNKTDLYTTKIPFGPFLGFAALFILFL